MHELIVRGETLTFQGKTYRCAVGKAGLIAAAEKREGDNRTPIGSWRLRECWYRPDRLARPETCLPLREIHETDGWCDDAAHADYNRHVTLPHPARHENLHRADHVYDLIIPLGYNDDPVVPGKGSAIFLHLAREQYEGTEGCVALARADFLEILPQLTVECSISVMPAFAGMTSILPR